MAANASLYVHLDVFHAFGPSRSSKNSRTISKISDTHIEIYKFGLLLDNSRI